MSTYVRAVLPEFQKVAEARGDELVVVATEEEFEVYADIVGDLERCVLPNWADSPGGSALCYFTMVSRLAERIGADVILYTAANRRLCRRRSNRCLPATGTFRQSFDFGQQGRAYCPRQ